jgi:hypothetical protein
LVEEMPLHYEQSTFAQKKGQALPSQQRGQQSVKREDRESEPFRYNYLSNAEKDLSVIREDHKEYLRDSKFSSCRPSPFSPSPSLLLPPSHPVPNFRYQEDILEAEASFHTRIRLEEQKLRTEEQRLRSALLEQ